MLMRDNFEPVTSDAEVVVYLETIMLKVRATSNNTQLRVQRPM